MDFYGGGIVGFKGIVFGDVRCFIVGIIIVNRLKKENGDFFLKVMLVENR